MSVPVSQSVEHWILTHGGPLKGHTGGEIGADTESLVSELEKRRGTSPQELLDGLKKFCARLKLIEEKGLKTGIPGVMGDDELGMEEPADKADELNMVAVVYNECVYGATMTAKNEDGTVSLKFAADGQVEEWDARSVRKAKPVRLLNSELMELQSKHFGFKYTEDEEGCAHHMLKVGEGATVLWLEGEDAEKIPVSVDDLGDWEPRWGTVIGKSVLHNGIFVNSVQTFATVFLPIEVIVAFQRDSESPFDLMRVIRHKSGRIRRKPGQFQAGEGSEKKLGRAVLPQRTPSRDSLKSLDSPRRNRSRTITPKSSPLRLPPGNSRNSPEKPEVKGSRTQKFLSAFAPHTKGDSVGVEDFRQLRSLVQDVGMGVADVRTIVTGTHDMLKENEAKEQGPDDKAAPGLQGAVEAAVDKAAKVASTKMAKELKGVADELKRHFSTEMAKMSKGLIQEFGQDLAATVQSNIGGQPLVMTVDGGPHVPIAQVKALEDDYRVPIKPSPTARTSSPAPSSPRPTFVQPLSPAPRSSFLEPKPKKPKRDARAAQGLIREYWQEAEYPVLEKLTEIPKADLPHWLINYHYNGQQQKPVANYASPISRDAGTFKALAPALLLYARSKDPDDLEMELNRLKANATVVWMAFRSALRVPNKGGATWDATMSLHNWFLCTAKHLCLLGLYTVGEIERLWPSTWRTTPDEEKGNVKEFLAPLSPKFHGTGVEDWFAAYVALFYYHPELKPQHLGVAEVKRAMASSRSSFVRARKGRPSGSRTGLDDTISSQGSNGGGDQDDQDLDEQPAA